MDAMTKIWQPLEIIFSIWDTWVCTSLLAYCKSTSYPAASNSAFMFEPSWFHLCKSFVGIATPTSAPAPPAGFSAGASVLGASVSAGAAASVAAGAAVVGAAVVAAVSFEPPHPVISPAAIAIVIATARNLFFIIRTSSKSLVYLMVLF